MTGLKGFHELGPAKALAYFSLTRGCLVITVDGQDSTAEYFPTYALGDEGWRKTVEHAQA